MARITTGHVVACLLISGLGAFFVYGALQLDLGTARNFGPGYFPLGLGAILIGLGGTLLLFDRVDSDPEDSEEFAVRPFLLVVAALLSFGAIVPAFGLLPGVFIATLAASAADQRTTVISALATAGTMAVLSWLVFKLGLGLPVPSLRMSDQWIF